MWYNSNLEQKSRLLSLLFSSRRVPVASSVNGIPADTITVDHATDVCVLSLALSNSNPTLRNIALHPIPLGAVNLCLANISPLSVLGFESFDITLGGITHSMDALAVDSLDPDVLLLDNLVQYSIGTRDCFLFFPPKVHSHNYHRS